MNREFANFLKLSGTTRRAKDIMGCKDSMLCHIIAGRRTVSQKIAKNIVDTYPTIDLYYLQYDKTQVEK